MGRFGFPLSASSDVCWVACFRFLASIIVGVGLIFRYEATVDRIAIWNISALPALECGYIFLNTDLIERFRTKD
jgi:hypothetical protein